MVQPSAPSVTRITHAYNIILHVENNTRCLTMVAITRGSDVHLLESVHRTVLSVLLTKHLIVAAPFPTAP